MAILSFAWTTTEFIAGLKTCTRRDWKPQHLEMWQRFYDRGDLTHEAWNKIPLAGGIPIGMFKLTCRPYLEPLSEMPPADLQAEGGMCATLEDFYQLVGLPPEKQVTVIRFEKLGQPNTYPPNWVNIATQVKKLAGWQCENCGHNHDTPNGYMLGVHHLDMDKANCNHNNLVALCQRCHLRIQATYRPGQLSFAPWPWAVKRGLM